MAEAGVTIPLNAKDSPGDCEGQPSSTLTPDRKTKLVYTVLLALTIGACGMCLALRGSTLMDLQRLTSSSLASASAAVFTCLAAGWVVGGIGGGALLDRFNKDVLLGLSAVGGGIAVVVIPWCSHIVLLGAAFVIAGIFIAACDAGGFAVCFQVWGPAAGPYIHLLNLTFALGSFLAPLVVEAFLKFSQNQPIDGLNLVNISLHNNSSSMPMISSTPVISSTISDNEIHETVTNRTCGLESSGQLNKLFWCTFVMMGGVLVMASIPFFAVSCRKHKAYETGAANVETKGPKFDKKFFTKIILLLTCFSFFNNAIEETFGGFLKVFALKQLCWSESMGNMLLSLYWGMYTLFRFLGFLEALWIHPGKTVLLHTAAVALSFYTLIIVTLWDKWLIFSSVLIGIAISPIYGARIAWTDRYIAVTGKVMGVICVAEGMGSIVWPALVGYLMEHFGPLCFVYMLCFLGTVTLVLFTVMHCIAKSHGERFPSENAENSQELQVPLEGRSCSSRK